MLEEVKTLAFGIGLNLEFDSSLCEYLGKVGYDKQYGARPLRRLITTTIENELSDRILDGEISKGDFVIVSYDDGVKFTKK